MTARSFVDTNVLFYAHDPTDGAKQEAARELIRGLVRSQSGVVSLQVLRELYSATRKKLQMSGDEARRLVVFYARLEVVQLTVDDLLAAIDLHRLHSIAFWDALIVRAATNARCKILYSEDLQNGRRFDDLEVRNPLGAGRRDERGRRPEASPSISDR